MVKVILEEFTAIDQKLKLSSIFVYFSEVTYDSKSYKKNLGGVRNFKYTQIVIL